MGYVSDRQASIRSELETLLPCLYRFATALTGTHAASLRLVRGVCKAALTRAAREKGQTPLAQWCYSQMHTLWMSELATRPRQRRQDLVEVSLFHAPLPGYPPNAFSAGLAKFIAQLPAHQRATLMLIYGLGLSYDEAAEVFGIQVSAVMTRLVRSHAGLARMLEAHVAAAEAADRRQAANAYEDAARVYNIHREFEELPA